ncbi:glycosyltransferase [Candidatus Kaiserbacteria bacterium]|nr:glycosyltransferase [Candidatus Kaiserbacteria bacterium]
MAKIKILFLITKANRGGAQRYVYDLATNLPKSDFDVIIAYGERGELALNLAKAGIKLHEVSLLRRDVAIVSDIRSFFELLHLFRELRPDVIHLNSSKAAALGALAARIARVPKILFTAHGWPFKESRNVISRALVYIASWTTARLSSEVIVVSKTDERLARGMWGVRKKVRYIPLGLPPLLLSPPQEAYRAMFGSLPPAPLSSETLRLVTIAELTENKGLRFAIRAVALLRERGIDVTYVIAGEGTDRKNLEALVRTHGLADRVFLPGHIKRAAENLAGFDVFILPSIKEGTPYSLLEAAQADIPIVFTDVIDKELIARLENARRVPTKDAVALADSITELARLPRNRARTEELFPLSTMLSETFRLYF